MHHSPLSPPVQKTSHTAEREWQTQATGAERARPFFKYKLPETDRELDSPASPPRLGGQGATLHCGTPRHRGNGVICWEGTSGGPAPQQLRADGCAAPRPSWERSTSPFVPSQHDGPKGSTCSMYLIFKCLFINVHIIYSTGPGRLQTQLSKSFFAGLCWKLNPSHLSVTSEPTNREMDTNADRDTAQHRFEVR